MRLTLQQLEAHLWGAANILRGKTAGQDYKNYILSLMFYKRLCDQWECEADDAIAELERQQSRAFSEKEKAVFRKRGEHRFQIPDGSRWGDVKAASTNLGEVLTKAMRAVANANDELRGVFTVDWNQPAPDGSGKPLIPNEVVHALVQHFDEHDLSNKSASPDVLGRAYLSFNWRLILAPDYVLRYLVTHEAVHLAIPDHSAKFWLTAQSLCRDTEKAKQWLGRQQAQLQVNLANILDRAHESGRTLCELLIG